MLNSRLFRLQQNQSRHFSTVLIRTNWYTISCKYRNCTALQKVNAHDLATWCKMNFGDVGSEDMYNANPLQYAHNLYIDDELVTNLVIPNSIDQIGEFTFDGCTSIESVTLPESLTRIDEYAFYGCTNLAIVNNWSKLNIVKGSREKGYVGYYATTINDSKCTIYDGNRNEIETLIPENIETTANALFFYNKPDKQTITNYINSNNQATKIALTDALPFYSPVSVSAETLTYTRNFTSTNWQPLYLPFALSYDNWKDYADVAYINNVHQWDDDKDGTVDRTILEFITKNSGSIEANKPYVIRPKQTGEVTFTSENTTLYAAPATDGYVDCRSTTTEYTLYGTYQEKTDMYENGYYAMVSGGFKQAESASVTLSPFRTYLKIESRTGAGTVQNAKKINIMVDGVIDDNDATGIQSILSTVDDDNENVYNLTGQKVGRDYKGIAIKNGKKFLIK